MKYLESLQIGSKKLVTRVDVLYGNFIDSWGSRFCLLIVTVICGGVVGKYTDIQFFYDSLNQSKYVSKYLSFIIYGIPTLALLWYFRTRDRIQQIEEIHEQINKTLTQIQHNKIISAIKHLNSDNIIREKVGADVLMKSLDRPSKFDDLIIDALLSAGGKFNRDKSRREHLLSDEEIEKKRQSGEYPCREKLMEYIRFPGLNQKEPESYKSNNFRLYPACAIIYRFLLLFIIGCVGGWLLGMVLNVQFLFDFFTQDMEIAEHLINIIIGIPMFVILWYFRTFDTRKQVNKMQEQASLPQKNIWQERFNIAIEELGSNDITREEIGFQSLRMLPKETLEFNELIAIAFEGAIDEFQRNISKKGIKYYNYEEAKKPGGKIALNLGDVKRFNLLVDKLGIEGCNIYRAREKIIIGMYVWVKNYKESENNNTTKS